jgi:hypothetical protein
MITQATQNEVPDVKQKAVKKGAKRPVAVS